MKFSYRWLKELSGTKRSPERLAELLMTHAFEVETIEPYPHSLTGVVIGKVLAAKKHPNADRLRVTDVQIGPKEKKHIVCGAPNVAAGQKVAVILPGHKLPNGTLIKEAELRGVKSQGMICSVKELGLGDDHAGILVLPDDAPVGKSFAAYIGLEDTVLDVKILPDRSSDALSYEGLAREIAALEGVAPAFLATLPKKPRLRATGKTPRLTLKTDRSCRYLAILVEDVTTTPSPLSVQARLLVSGLRPINRVVDLTNYLMLQTGQPVHAFDADAIPRGGLVIRQGKARERLLLLDGTTITLTADDIVIADGKKPLALAGVMGGKHSGISDKTKRVVFEIAHFNAASVRRTTKRHKLLSDAAYRFERGIDDERPELAAVALVHLARAWGVGTPAGLRAVGHNKRKPTVITLEVEAAERLLGTKVPLFEIVQIFSWLGLGVKKLPNRPALKVTIPARRLDLRTPEDLIEEIGRVRGYDRIESRLPALPLAPVTLSPAKAFERRSKDWLMARGFDEVMTYSFYDGKSVVLSGKSAAEHLTLANPMNPSQEKLRASLLPNLLDIARTNAKHGAPFRCFEYGSVYTKGAAAPSEEKHLGFVWAEHVKQAAPEPFFRFKAALADFLAAFGITARFEAPVATLPPGFHPTRVARLFHGNTLLGTVGALHPQELRQKMGHLSILMAELSVPALLAAERTSVAYREVSKFPLAHRDISLVGPKTVTFGTLEMVIRAAGEPLLAAYELFDVYEQGDEKSFALHLAFGATDRTLSGPEMDAAFERIVQAAGERLGMRLRV
jgi:phenylalanyl-tRNA synthetase beta chain